MELINHLSLWRSQFSKLQTSGGGVIFLEISWGSGFAPIADVERVEPVGVEPNSGAGDGGRTRDVQLGK